MEMNYTSKKPCKGVTLESLRFCPGHCKKVILDMDKKIRISGVRDSHGKPDVVRFLWDNLNESHPFRANNWGGKPQGVALAGM